MAAALRGGVVGSRAEEPGARAGVGSVAAGLAGRWGGVGLGWRLRRPVFWDRASGRYGVGGWEVAGWAVGGWGKVGRGRRVEEVSRDFVGKVSEEARGVPLVLVRPSVLLRRRASLLGGSIGSWRVEEVDLGGGGIFLFVPPCAAPRIGRLLTLSLGALLTSFSLLRWWWLAKTS
jgi:hypothetical protein